MPPHYFALSALTNPMMQPSGFRDTFDALTVFKYQQYNLIIFQLWSAIIGYITCSVCTNGFACWLTRTWLWADFCSLGGLTYFALKCNLSVCDSHYSVIMVGIFLGDVRWIWYFILHLVILNKSFSFICVFQYFIIVSHLLWSHFPLHL